VSGEICTIVRQPCVVRFARLDSTGATPAGVTNGYIATGFIEGTITPVYEDTDALGAITDACDNVMLDDPAHNLYRGSDVELQFGPFAPERMELTAALTLLTNAGSTVGWAMPAQGLVNPPGVSVEIWLNNYTYGSANVLATNNFVRCVMPKLINPKVSPLTLGRANQIQTITGRAVDNPGFGNGPANDILVITPTTRSVYFYQENTRPTAACGYFTIPTQT
jgi:hypothetical protein